MINRNISNRSPHQVTTITTTMSNTPNACSSNGGMPTIGDDPLPFLSLNADGNVDVDDAAWYSAGAFSSSRMDDFGATSSSNQQQSSSLLSMAPSYYADGGLGMASGHSHNARGYATSAHMMMQHDMMLPEPTPIDVNNIQIVDRVEVVPNGDLSPSLLGSLLQGFQAQSAAAAGGGGGTNLNDASINNQLLLQQQQRRQQLQRQQQQQQFRRWQRRRRRQQQVQEEDRLGCQKGNIIHTTHFTETRRQTKGPTRIATITETQCGEWKTKSRSTRYPAIAQKAMRRRRRRRRR
mmetsp:Transcript_8794/g.25315  ORF Transcript_8794/g.25315 Transcript_8794/m.25315 type:complete len:293 (-) Transcript_8794:542-1420(-)